ncbi:MAG: redoxin domain-containing protein [Candidatus Rokubacteria bacterium]|nr:redoxin domain-containing protein [Candidatus Rokubacteria bacterium]
MGRIRSLGAEVVAVSSDRTEDVRRMAAELGFAFPVLSNPSLDVIYLYSMKGPMSTMADMGYVLIDAAGFVRLRQVDHRFGEHADEIVEHLRGMTQAKAGSP